MSNQDAWLVLSMHRVVDNGAYYGSTLVEGPFTGTESSGMLGEGVR